MVRHRSLVAQGVLPVPFTSEQLVMLRSAPGILLDVSGSRAEIAYLYLRHVLGLEAIRGIVSDESSRILGMDTFSASRLPDAGPGMVFVSDHASPTAKLRRTIFIDDQTIVAMRFEYADWMESFLAGERRNVVLYGAGWYARTLLRSLREKPFRSAVQCMMITGKPASGSGAQGVPVIGIAEADEDLRKTPILIATDERAHSEIMNTLRQHGFIHVFPQTFETINRHVQRLAEEFLHSSTNYRLIQSPFAPTEFLVLKAPDSGAEPVESVPHWIFRSAVTAQWDAGRELMAEEDLLQLQHGLYGATPMIKALAGMSDAPEGEESSRFPMYVARSIHDQGVRVDVPSWGMLTPLHVGAAASCRKEPALTDDTGDNISRKNSIYSEMTGVYWLWRNAPQTEYIGFCHYRRHFSLNSGELARVRLSGVDIVVSVLPLSVPDNREFFIWSGYLSREIFVLLDELVQEKVPEYTSSFHVVCDSPLLVPCNMFIMRWLWFDKYCSWLFPLAEELERRVADAGLATPRYMGYVTEILMSVFIAHHKNDAKIALADRIVLT